MKLKIIWNNGDKETIEVSNEYAESFKKNPPFGRNGFHDWILTLKSNESDIGGLNMCHARRVWIDD